MLVAPALRRRERRSPVRHVSLDRRWNYLLAAPGVHVGRELLLRRKHLLLPECHHTSGLPSNRLFLAAKLFAMLGVRKMRVAH